MGKKAPAVGEKERARIDNDYYTSDTSEFQTYSQDSKFLAELLGRHAS